jgi:tRNA(adenine34) deaminase
MGISTVLNDSYWMQQAYEQALQALAQNEVPVGAVIVSEDNQLLGVGYNQVIKTHDPSAHAEMVAIRAACAAAKNYRLSNVTLYVTLEPCVMCAGAMVQSRIQRVVFATPDPKAGAAGSVYNLLGGYPLNHRVQIENGPMQQDCAQLLKDFFKIRRR